ncbi:MAG: aldehyde dehydrogenase family protein [Planctomycetota bacterium]|nr:aldehyde dehydrogenase family protein [Planctomycetota bacterium]
MILADADLRSIQEARDLVRRSRKAWMSWRRADQAQVDRVCEAMARAGSEASEMLAKLAVEESGFGNAAGKFQKNKFCTEMLWESLRDLQTVGVVQSDDARRYYQVAEPYGPVLAIVPITNPTSTAMFKSLISVKARNSIVISPHPRGVRCIGEATRIMAEAAKLAGAPDDLILCMSEPTLEGTHEAMKARETALILATGGPGLVRAAYSAGKPAYGVGPGNAPAFIERSADVEHAVRAIIGSQMFDNATICASEQSVVIDRPIESEVRASFTANGGHWCTPEEKTLLERIVVRGRRVNADIVGLYPHQIAAMAGFTIPEKCTVLLVDETGVGWDYPLSVEKLSPILSVYVEDGWEAGCDRCIEILDFGGRGHTLAIHSRNEDIIWSFVAEKPTHRILVNAPTAQGAVGFGTGLVPSMTLGCGAFGGNITSDNISAHNLLLTKHVGYCYDGFVESFPDFSKGPPRGFHFSALPAAPAPGPASASGSSAIGTSSPVSAPRAPLPARANQLAGAPLAHPGNPTHPASPFAENEGEAAAKGASVHPSPAHQHTSSGGTAPTGKPPYEGGEIPDFSKLRYRT